MKRSANQNNPISEKNMNQKIGAKRNLKWTIGCYGFSGFIGLLALRAFEYHNPLYLFLFSFFSFFWIFRYWKDELKYLGLSGVLGLIIPALWVVGLFKV